MAVRAHAFPLPVDANVDSRNGVPAADTGCAFITVPDLPKMYRVKGPGRIGSVWISPELWLSNLGYDQEVKREMSSR